MAILFGAQIALGSANGTDSRPNLLFFLADDLGYADLACFGSPVIRTPHIDRLASQGLRLTNCYAASPNCSPSRAAILTGRNPYRVGFYDHAWGESPLHIPVDEVTLPELLGQAGYQTMFAGKWHCSGLFGDPSQPQPGDHGFDHWFAHRASFGADPDGFVRNGTKLGALQGWPAELVVDEAISWLEGRDPERPFCAFLWFSEPHSPVVAPPRFVNRYRNDETDAAARELRFGGVPRHTARSTAKASYFGCVSMLDDQVGRMLAALDDMQLAKDTVVVFTSDNGPEHRHPDSFGSPGLLRGAKGYVHEGGIRVPGIVRWPGRIPSGATSSTPVNGTDFLPTVCALAGLDVPNDRPIDGVDLLPALLRGEPVARPVEMFWWLAHARGGKQVAMRDGDYKMLARLSPQARPESTQDARPPKGWSMMQFIKEAGLDGFAL